VLEKLKDPGLNRTRYRNPDALAAQMDGYLGADVSVPLFDAFEKFTVSGLKAGTKNKYAAPEHPFFQDCEVLRDRAEALADQMEGKLLYLKTALFRYLRQELPKRKKIKNIQFYDDLLLNLKSALEKPGGPELRDHLRKRYRAALIDEFQDTDPIQYAIFRTVFGGGAAPLFLIGDPKQSIYSFRGADLFAYMKAARHCDHRYTLNRNWRSEPGLIDAVNAVFANPPKVPFLYEDIPFSGAVAAEVAERPCLTVDGRREAPFHLWYVGSDRLDAAGAKGNKQRTGDLIIGACAGEIARLLHLGAQGKARIGAEPLAAQHLAVLVRTHLEARLVRDALAALSVPCVLHSLGNLFDTHEAREMGRVLAAIEDSRSGGLIRAALATDMLGVKGEDLAVLAASENGTDPWMERFCDYRDRWERFGCMEMFRGFMTREKVRERLLAFPDGERRLTNVLHLMEVLHTESVAGRLAVPGLMKWLDRQMDPATLRLEEHELRLESDARAVRIVTIHKSKGLEYPVVFCPFNWGGSTLKEDAFAYHDPEADWRLNLVLAGGDPAMKALAEKERLAENIRLLYVTLTRARNRCCLVWGPFKDAGASALAYVLHPPAGGNGEVPDIVALTDSAFQGLSDADIRADLGGVAARSKGAIRVYDMPLPEETLLAPPPEQAEPMTCRAFKGALDTDRRIASFSYLIHDRTAAPVMLPLEEEAVLTELPDHDGQVERAAPLVGEEPAGILAFERGAQAGNLLHEILEKVDFADAAGDEAARIVEAGLKKYGYDLSWSETVFAMIQDVMNAPLHEKFGGLTLAAVKRERRVSEMGFYFPLKRLTREALQKLFREGGLSAAESFPQQMERLAFHPVRGFMKGFMDLVFHHDGRYFLCDWN
jgi:exodeoxyribonuclease V beta subunit